MRPARPARALLLPFIRPHSSPQCPHLSQTPRNFHTTPIAQRRRPAHKSLSQEELQRVAEARKGYFLAYTEQEKQQLAKTYTPEQVAAIEAAEKAIDPADLATQAAPRRDPFKFGYLEDFSRVESTIDKRPSKLRGEGEDYENVRDYAKFTQPEDKMKQIADVLLEPGMEDEEGLGSERDTFAELWAKALSDTNDMPISDGMQEALDFDTGDNRNIDVDTMADATSAALQYQQAKAAPPASGAKESKMTTYAKIQSLLREYDNHHDPPDVAPDIPKINDPGVRWETPGDEDASAADDETAVAYARLAKAINQSVETIRKYRTKTLVTHRVVNQTRLGKIDSMYFLVVAGDEKGMVGIGEGKAAEGDEASRVARLNAIRNMKPIRRYENRTIFGEVKGKSGAAEVTLAARPPGFGLRVSSHVFEIAKCAGLYDLHARSTRSRNPMNNCKAIWQALLSQRDPEEIARSRNKKLVDVRKVYYAGLV